MRHAARWLGLVVATIVIVSTTQLPSASQDPRDAHRPDTQRLHRKPQAEKSSLAPTLSAPVGLTPSIRQRQTSALNHTGLKTSGGGVILQADGILEVGDATLSDGSLYDLYPFEGQSGQLIQIRLESDDFDPYLILQNARGQQISVNDDSIGELNSTITVELPQDGTYQVIANAYDRSGQGVYHLQVQEIDNASYQRALEIERQKIEADRLFALGNQHYGEDQFQAALPFWEQALDLYQIIGDRAAEGWTLNSIGLVYENLSQYEIAIQRYQQSMAIAREIDHSILQGMVSGNLGDIYNVLGQYEDAITLHERHLVLALESGNRVGEADALNSLGISYYYLGQYELVIDLFEQSIEIFRAIENSTGVAGVSGDLGFVYYALGQYPQAIELHQQHLAIAQTLGDRPGEARALNNLGLAYSALGNFEQATNLYQQSLAIFRDLGLRQREGTALNRLGRLFHRQNQPELAIIFLKASVEVRESIRGGISGLDTDLQQSFTDTIADDYRLLADLLLQQDRIIEAQRVLDLLKVQELDDYLQDVQRNVQTEGGVAYLRPEESILMSYSSLQQSAIEAGQDLAELKAIPQSDRTEAQNQRIAQLTVLLDEINGDFRDFARSPEIRELITQLSYEAQDASLRLNQLDGLRDELQQLNAAIFYPLVLEDRLELVITVPDAPPLRRTVTIGREDLNRTILDFREALTNPGSAIEAPAQQLYRWLIEPLESDLAAAGVDTIIYSPDGQLRYIPLAALYDGEKWLTQRYQINNITAESLTNLTATNRSQPRILAAAYADINLVHTPEVNGTSYTFRGLPGAGDEVANLPTTQTFLDEAFSLNALRPIMDEYTILHFATHAAFVPGIPEDSFILFGNGDTPTLRDIENWSLNGVELVVLSACETGVGGLGNGEEVLGLGYQFQVSGARAVMASLWQVSDRGTQILMDAFYDALGRGLPKTEALQWAQAAMISGDAILPDDLRGGIAVSQASSSRFLSHPYYWAPFIIVGNGL